MSFLDGITKEQMDIANAIDLMMYYISKKRILDIVPEKSNQTMFNAVAQEVGHSIIHLLSGKCSDKESIDFDTKVSLGQSMAALFIMGVYMAENSMAKIGKPEAKDPSEIQ